MDRIHISWLTVSFLLCLSFNFGSGLQCYNCNSTSAADCAVNPTNQLQSVECPQKDDICVMAVLDDMVTYRGCSSQIAIPEDCEYCMSATCKDNLCNSGIYPQDRLKCHRCQREECVNVTEPPLACRNYDSADFCYVDVIDETDVIRGCVSDDDYDAGVYTVFCKTDGCNNVSAVSQFSCLSCDSDKDDNCKVGDTSNLICKVNVTNVCTLDLLYGRRESCFIYQDEQRVVRGCSRFNSELIMQTQYVTLCRDKNCNSACVSNPTCYVCDSNEDSKCYDEQTALIPQDCPLETSSCFTCKHEDESITRGCRNESTLFKSDTCVSCWKTSGCNTGTINTCSSCHSAKDKNCATWLDTSSLDNTACNGECVVKITREGHTVRGCKSESFYCSGNMCKECIGDNCNAGIFPVGRQTCYQCDGTDSQCRLNQKSELPGACPKYSSADGCFQYTNDEGLIMRGCLSEQRYVGCHSGGNNTCKICYGPGCNYEEMASDKLLQCHYCQSDEEQSCGWAQTETKDCQPRSANDSFSACFTYSFPNKTVARGCMSNSDACDPADVTCEICAKDGCNGENVVYQHCIQCNGTLDEGNCAFNGAEIEPTVCPGNIQWYDGRGCYIKFESTIVSRGCLNTLSTDDINECRNSQNCKMCLGQGCNFQNIINSAGQLSYTILYLYLMWVVVQQCL